LGTVLDIQPLSAYTLGVTKQKLWEHTQVPLVGSGDTWKNTGTAVLRLLRLALDALDSAIPSGILPGLYDCLNQVEQFFSEKSLNPILFCLPTDVSGAPDLAFGTGALSLKSWGEAMERRTQLLERLDRLLAAGVGNSPKLARWFRLGETVGSWESAALSASGGEDQLVRVLREAQEVTASNTLHLPTVQRLASLLAEEGSETPYLARLVGLLPDELRPESLSRLVDDPSWLEPAISWVTTAIEDDLRNLSREKSSRRPPKPKWDGSKLWYMGQVVRRVRVSKADNVVAVLNAFQEENWPNTVLYPNEADIQTLHYTVRSLNDGLKVLRFRADGTGRGIMWGLAD